MGKREENKAAIRDRILRQAIPMFEQYGYNMVSLADIAREAQVSTRTLYRYFPKKLDILLGFVEVKMDRLSEYADQLSGDPEDRVLDMMVFDFCEMYYRYDMSFIFETVHDKDNQITECRIRNERRREAMYRDLIIAEQEKLGVRNEAAAQIASDIICAVFFYAGSLLHRNQLKQLPAAAIKKHYKRYVDVMWDGLMREASISAQEA